LKTFCFDLDGVICSNTFGNYAEAIPFQKAIDKINQLAEDGNKIIIFTSRFMGMNNENINKANLQGFDMTYNQLKKWNVKFDKLILGKPTYDIMIDDKHFLYDDTWIDKLK
tara:strand:- start:177 stop:509 length:333 start_codon:yes stop_codon:yes gene_type:complete